MMGSVVLERGEGFLEVDVFIELSCLDCHTILSLIL